MRAGMKRSVVTLLLALPLALGNATATALENATIKLDDNTIIASLLNYEENDIFKKRLDLPPSSGVTIAITDVPSDFSFIILQIHTYQYNATLAYDKTLLDKVSKGSLFGSNIGLYMKTRNVTGPIQVFLKHDNLHDLDALLVIVPYGPNAPIPGGCNMEFEIEIAPYQKLHLENEMIIVDAQPASALGANGLSIPCEKNPVRHSMYRLHLPIQDFSPETYFDSIASMLTVQDIVRNGTEIPPNSAISSMRRIYSIFAGTGFVYAVVATYGSYSSAYVPTFSYGCSPVLYRESCQLLNDAFSKVVCSTVLFIGILSVLMGHKPQYVSVYRLLSYSVMGGYAGYTLAVGAGVSGTANAILVGLTFAILAVCISRYMHSCEYQNVWFLLLSNLPLGFLCGSIVYLYAPVGMSYVLTYDATFWLIFVSLMLAVATLLMILSHMADTIARAIFGAYFMIIANDYFIGGNLKYIMITMIRRVTIPEFRLAFVYPPLQTPDLIEIFLWIVLIILQLINMCRTHVSSASGERQNLLAGSGAGRRAIFSYIGDIRYIRNIRYDSTN